MKNFEKRKTLLYRENEKKVRAIFYNILLGFFTGERNYSYSF